MRRILVAWTILTLLVGSALGCGSIRDATGLHEEAFDEPGPHVFGGVRVDAVLGAREASGHLAPVCLFYWLDLPLDIVLDTLFLPWTAIRSLEPEGRDYVTVDRAGLERAILEDQSLSRPGSLLYMGSEDGYHRLLFHHTSYAERPLRIRENEFRIKEVFPYVAGSHHSVTLKGAPWDPWPLPEPVWADFNSVVVDRAGLDQAVLRNQSLPHPGTLVYLGSEGGYHRLQFRYAKSSYWRQYRVPEGEFSIKEIFPYKPGPPREVPLKRPQDPWPLPEPLKERTEEK